jgi:hypothetical protein
MNPGQHTQLRSGPGWAFYPSEECFDEGRQQGVGIVDETTELHRGACLEVLPQGFVCFGRMQQITQRGVRRGIRKITYLTSEHAGCGQCDVEVRGFEQVHRVGVGAFGVACVEIVSKHEQQIGGTHIPDDRAAWGRARMTPLPTANKHGLWVLLGTMLRVGELCGSLRCYIDLQRREWRLPPELVKTEAEHVVYVSDFAIEHLRAFFALTDSPWVLPHPNDTRKPIPPELFSKRIGASRSGPTPGLCCGRGRSVKTCCPTFIGLPKAI